MIGYTWITPIDDGLYHVGCAYYKNDHELWTYLTNTLKKCLVVITLESVDVHQK